MDAEYLNLQLESVDGLLASLPPNSCVKTLNLHYNLLNDLKGLKNMNNYVKNIVEINVSSNRYVIVDVAGLFLDVYVNLDLSCTYLVIHEYLSHFTHSLTHSLTLSG